MLSALREQKLSSERGIPCPKCGCRDWRVRNTVLHTDAIHRYRICRNCSHTRRTVEKAG